MNHATRESLLRGLLDSLGAPAYVRDPRDCAHHDESGRPALVEVHRAESYGCRICGALWDARDARGRFRPAPSLCPSCGRGRERGILCAPCWYLVPAPTRAAYYRELRRGRGRPEFAGVARAAIRAALAARERARRA
ncbi:MAG: hypothetical protein DCC71_15370 [Proteobacteria bacterium]|nr:MAG: hypothetical protein DCC71_15370 [Pseudomonadota bacterium]